MSEPYTTAQLRALAPGSPVWLDLSGFIGERHLPEPMRGGSLATLLSLSDTMMRGYCGIRVTYRSEVCDYSGWYFQTERRPDATWPLYPV